jgi:hypothetical protein
MCVQSLGYVGMHVCGRGGARAEPIYPSIYQPIYQCVSTSNSERVERRKSEGAGEKGEPRPQERRENRTTCVAYLVS